MPEIVERVTVFCFAASYVVALAMEVWHLLAPRPIQRYLALGFGGAGLLAHTIYVLVQPLQLTSPFGSLLLLAAVGICVGFVASVMYLVQVYRLRAKLPPGQGFRLWSLERIEEMNRRAILWAFPLLTAGLLVGIALQLQSGILFSEWSSPKIMSSIGLWLVFAILLYLRYGVHARGRQVAILTVVAFAVLLFALASPVHPYVVHGGGP